MNDIDIEAKDIDSLLIITREGEMLTADVDYLHISDGPVQFVYYNKDGEIDELPTMEMPYILGLSNLRFLEEQNNDRIRISELEDKLQKAKVQIKELTAKVKDKELSLTDAEEENYKQNVAIDVLIKKLVERN